MACLLCYGTSDDLIDLISDEAKQYEIAAVLFKYFSFCFNVSFLNKFHQIKNIIENKIATDQEKTFRLQ